MDNEREYLPWMSDYTNTTLVAASHSCGPSANEYNSNFDCALQLECIGEYVGRWYMVYRSRNLSCIAYHLITSSHASSLLYAACLCIKLISSSNHTTSTTISKTRMTRATAKQQRQPTRRIYSQVHHDLPIIIHSAAPSRTTSASLHRRTRFASQNPGLNCPQGRVGISLKALQTWCRWANTRVAPARVKSLHETHPSVGNKTSVVGSVDTENVLSSASNSDVV
jgi:hypothetical protein